MKISVALLALLAISAFGAGAERLEPVATRDSKVVRRWKLDGDPRGVAIGAGHTIYVGLAAPQAVIAVDSATGEVRKRVVLDSPDIASTKELVTLRTNHELTRLYIANGSDESATILSLPDLGVVREITMEGEAIRDVVPDPAGRYVYLLGRRVHVFDAAGENELHTLPYVDPMAIALSSNGRSLAVIRSELFGSTKATVASIYETERFSTFSDVPLQTEATFGEAMFADHDAALVTVGPELLSELPLEMKNAPAMAQTTTSGPMRMKIEFGDLSNTQHICLPEGSGPQIAVLASQQLLLFAERRCSSSGAFTGSQRRVDVASLYGVNAYAIAYDTSANTLAVSDRAGTLTIYKVPSVHKAR